MKKGSVSMFIWLKMNQEATVIMWEKKGYTYEKNKKNNGK